jgi:hypothetical protein
MERTKRSVPDTDMPVPFKYHINKSMVIGRVTGEDAAPATPGKFVA